MKGKVRTIYNNYDLWEDYEEVAREYLNDGGNDNPTDDEIWDEINNQDELIWDYEKELIEKFFSTNKGTWIIFGTVGRWDGSQSCGYIFTDFWDAWNKAISDCDFVHLYDINGHLYLECTHHDGTNHYEIKKLTEKGKQYYENWEYNWDDKRTVKYVHNKIIEKYSVLPHYAHQVFRCPKREYEKKVG